MRDPLALRNKAEYLKTVSKFQAGGPLLPHAIFKACPNSGLKHGSKDCLRGVTSLHVQSYMLQCFHIRFQLLGQWFYKYCTCNNR